MPSNLDIETSKDLNGTMAAYSEQIIISTGQADWKSRIEDERDTAPWGNVVSEIKTMLGPGGRCHDVGRTLNFKMYSGALANKRQQPYRSVVVSTSSFEAPSGSSGGLPQALFFPSFSVVDDIGLSQSSIAHLLETFVASKSGSIPSGGGQKESEETRPDKEKSLRQSGTIRPISAPTILICSHNSRDSRCGILGPLLHAEFVHYINKRHTLRNRVMSELVVPGDEDNQGTKSFASHPTYRPEAVDPAHSNQQPINVGMISHIGGHKWAGNVIVYIPPDYQINSLERSQGGTVPKDKRTESFTEPVVHKDERLLAQEILQSLSPLAGKGIWYGRVQPKHVEGIVEQTIGHGQIIRELFRGGVHRNGNQIRL